MAKDDYKEAYGEPVKRRPKPDHNLVEVAEYVGVNDWADAKSPEELIIWIKQAIMSSLQDAADNPEPERYKAEHKRLMKMLEKEG